VSAMSGGPVLPKCDMFDSERERAGERDEKSLDLDLDLDLG
jgi:hypothetical protein